MSSPIVLLVEDEPHIAQIQMAYLKQAGFDVRHLSRGDEVVPFVRHTLPDLVLLDVMLPGADGISICRELRTFMSAPVILVTARVEEADRLLGFDAGADDYLCKPFSPKEMVARVQAVLRRVKAGDGTKSISAQKETPLEIRDQEQRAFWKGTRLDLTVQQFRLLKVLASKPGRVFSRAQLIELAFDSETDVYDRVVDSHIKNLRKKLAAEAEGDDIIRSVYGAGYCLEIKET